MFFVPYQHQRPTSNIQREVVSIYFLLSQIFSKTNDNTKQMLQVPYYLKTL